MLASRTEYSKEQLPYLEDHNPYSEGQPPYLEEQPLYLEDHNQSQFSVAANKQTTQNINGIHLDLLAVLAILN